MFFFHAFDCFRVQIISNCPEILDLDGSFDCLRSNAAHHVTEHLSRFEELRDHPRAFSGKFTAPVHFRNIDSEADFVLCLGRFEVSRVTSDALEIVKAEF